LLAVSEAEGRVERPSAYMQRALVVAIRAYRRWLSGRGPLRQVRCTFHDNESCSAFGLRAAREAPSARVALGRIRRRIRRCGDASLFALDALPETETGARARTRARTRTRTRGGSETSIRVLGWGADHDRPLDELHTELVEDGETDAVRARVLSAREVASRWRGDIGDVLAVRALRLRKGSFDSAFGLAQDERGLPAVRPRLRRPPTFALVARAFVWRLAVAAMVVVPAALVAPIVGLALAAIAALPLAAFVRGHIARRARLTRQARAAALAEPDGNQLFASLAKRCIVDAISEPRLHSTIPKPSM
jgi:putative component of membrane protein insertase Oxa1/YidC/SpoIIIJ protein YidD